MCKNNTELEATGNRKPTTMQFPCKRHCTGYVSDHLRGPTPAGSAKGSGEEGGSFFLFWGILDSLFHSEHLQCINRRTSHLCVLTLNKKSTHIQRQHGGQHVTCRTVASATGFPPPLCPGESPMSPDFPQPVWRRKSHPHMQTNHG